MTYWAELLALPAHSVRFSFQRSLRPCEHKRDDRGRRCSKIVSAREADASCMDYVLLPPISDAKLTSPQATLRDAAY